MISVKGLSLKYVNEKRNVFENISFNVKKGEILAIVGKSGIGKTSLLNAIGNIDTESMSLGGEISFGKDEPIIRMAFQTNILLPWYKIKDNLKLGLIKHDTLADQRIRQYLDKAGLGGCYDRYPSELSVGMRQRANFLRALISGPDILLLDEPFSSLDNATKKIMYSLLLEYVDEKEVTCILVTHNIKEAEYLSDSILDMKKFTNKSNV